MAAKVHFGHNYRPYCSGSGGRKTPVANTLNKAEVTCKNCLKVLNGR